MHKTLVIGGVSPIGYQISVYITKQIKTCLQIIDSGKLKCNKNYRWTTLSEFINTPNNATKYDLLVVNLSDLLSENRQHYGEYTLYIQVYNKIFDIIGNNKGIKIIVITNEHQNLIENNVLRHMNSFFLEYIILYERLNNLSIKRINESFAWNDIKSFLEED